MEDRREETRRESDKDDHDSLVKLQRDMKYLCGMVKDLKDTVNKQHDICSCRMKDCSRFFVPNRVFYTALSLVVLVLATLGTVAYENQRKVSVNMERIQNNTQHIVELYNKGNN